MSTVTDMLVAYDAALERVLRAHRRGGAATIGRAQSGAVLMHATALRRARLTRRRDCRQQAREMVRPGKKDRWWRPRSRPQAHRALKWRGRRVAGLGTWGTGRGKAAPKTKAADHRQLRRPLREENSGVAGGVLRIQNLQPTPLRRPGWLELAGVKGVRPVSYRLPELVSSGSDAPVIIVEGEKDADRVASLGLISTCNAGGASKLTGQAEPALRWAQRVHPAGQR